MPADTAVRLVGPTVLTTTAATYYTVPAVTKTVIRNIIANNTTAAALTFTMSIGANAAGTQLFSATSIPANSVMEFTGFIVMDAGQIIQALASATGLTLTISGVETA